MGIYGSICSKRTVRLFKPEKISYDLLKNCVDAARLSSSARNSQPLEYIIVEDKKILKKVIPLLNFGGFISENRKAVKGSEPVALIVMLVKKDAGEYYKYDVGIAAQNICLVAYQNKLGSCMMGSIDRPRIKEELNIPDDYLVDLVIALGYPKENPVLEESKNKTDYYRRDGVLYIPKRTLKSVLHRNRF